VPLIIDKGWEWYAGIGTEGSKGTKIFSLVGKINNTGLVEVPMGVPLREIIFDIGGGIPGGKKFKAVQTGGPSGGCIPEEMLDLPVDFRRAGQGGLHDGLGGMIVMDEGTCMVDIARYFLDFLKEESCGKCVPCREGIARSPGDPEPDLRRQWPAGGYGSAGGAVAKQSRTFPCAPWAGRRPTPCSRPSSTFAASTRPTSTTSAARRGSASRSSSTGSIPIFAPAAVPAFGSAPSRVSTGEKKAPHVINICSCIKCGACYDVCRFQAIVIRSGEVQPVPAAWRRTDERPDQGPIDGHEALVRTRTPRSWRPLPSWVSRSRPCATTRSWSPTAPAACARWRSWSGAGRGW
jgi:NAD-dependent dihydropyrimidine dehydrogenase PreA subunit